jgi:hypothetical protein
LVRGREPYFLHPWYTTGEEIKVPDRKPTGLGCKTATGEEIKVRDREPTGLGCKTAFQSNRKAVKLKKRCFAAFMLVLPETNF